MEFIVSAFPDSMAFLFHMGIEVLKGFYKRREHLFKRILGFVA